MEIQKKSHHNNIDGNFLNICISALKKVFGAGTGLIHLKQIIDTFAFYFLLVENVGNNLDAGVDSMLVMDSCQMSQWSPSNSMISKPGISIKHGMINPLNTEPIAETYLFPKRRSCWGEKDGYRVAYPANTRH